MTAADVVIADRSGEVFLLRFTDSFECSIIIDSLQEFLELVFVFVKKFNWLRLYGGKPFCKLFFGQACLGSAECLIDLPQMFLYAVGKIELVLRDIRSGISSTGLHEGVQMRTVVGWGEHC